jgi:flagellar biosynthetic protein FliR
MAETTLAQLFVFPFFLIFVRLSGVLLVFPGYADPAVPPRVRAILAVLITALLFPSLGPSLPPMPSLVSGLIALVVTELFIGILIATGARLFMSTMLVAGELISFMSGFQSATLFDPRSQSLTSAPGQLLMVLAITFIFLTNLHHSILNAVVDSYRILPVGQMPAMGDTVQAYVQLLGQVFIVGLKLAAPVMAVGFLSYAGFGLLNRLVPSVQAFFVSMPVNIMLGLFVFGVSLGGMLTLFVDELSQNLALFTQQ